MDNEIVDTFDGEIVEDLSTKAGRAQHWLNTRKLRNFADWREVEWAISAGLHTDLGMTEAEFCAACGPRLKLAKGERAKASRELVDERNYSQRVAAAILGVTQDTIYRDVNPDRKRSEKLEKPSSESNPDRKRSNPDTDKLTQEIAELKRQLAEATKPAVTGQDKVQAELKDKIAQLEATVNKQTQQMMEISSERSDLQATLEKLATSKDERERQQVALAALNKVGQAVTSRAAARIDASQVAWDIRKLNQQLDTLIQGKGDDISDNDAASIIRDFNELAQTIQVLKSRVEINKL